ncbi:MAG: hypothetical protein ABI678_13695 [Kofleriaceae bacterium]
MRTLVGLAVLLLPALAHADERALSARDVEAKLAPVSAQIESCYLERTAEVHGAGHLDLVLTVSRHGILENLAVKTPGLSSKLAKQIDGCIRDTIAQVSFPAKRVTTTATVPYFFQRTAAPNAGPQLSCWNASGCRGK